MVPRTLASSHDQQLWYRRCANSNICIVYRYSCLPFGWMSTIALLSYLDNTIFFIHEIICWDKNLVSVSRCFAIIFFHKHLLFIWSNKIVHQIYIFSLVGKWCILFYFFILKNPKIVLWEILDNPPRKCCQIRNVYYFCKHAIINRQQLAFWVTIVIYSSFPGKKWPPFWQTTISNAFSLMKILEFQFEFHRNLFPEE